MSTTTIPCIAFLLAITTQVHVLSGSKAVMTLNPGQGETSISFEGSVPDHTVTIKGVGTCIPQVKCDGAAWRSSCKEDYVMVSDPTGNEVYLSRDQRSRGYWAKTSGDRSDLEVQVHTCPDSSIGYSCSARCECSCAVDPGVVAGQDEILLVLGRRRNVSLTFDGQPIKRTPIDLYFLADYSKSMKPELGRFLKYKDEVKKVLVKYANDQGYRFGVGLFVEKENPKERPDDFSYFNAQALDSDWEKGISVMKKYNDSSIVYDGGLPPESQLDAIYQAATCTKEVGWRTSAPDLEITRIMVLVTDCTYWDENKYTNHPAPSACYLDGAGVYSDARKYNYPSVKQVAEVLGRLNVNIALTIALTQDYTTYKDKNVVADYTALTKAVGWSANLAYLDREWSNLSTIIEDKYGAIIQPGINLKVDGTGAGPEIRLTFYSLCNRMEVQSAACFLVGFAEPKFIVEVELVSCPKTGTNTLRQVQFNLVGGPGGTQKRIKKFRLDCGKKSG